MNSIITSIVRTIVPVLVAACVTWLADRGILVPQDVADQFTVSTILVATVVVTGVYYGVARWLEQRFPAFSLLLGSTSQPATYAKSTPVTEVKSYSATYEPDHRADDESGVDVDVVASNGDI